DCSYSSDCSCRSRRVLVVTERTAGAAGNRNRRAAVAARVGRVRARERAAGAGLSARPRTASRLSDRVVVLYWEFAGGERRALWLSTDVFPSRRRCQSARERLGLAVEPGLFRAFCNHGRAELSTPRY